ncbi:MAG TPA: single-stranded DNA-binding protein [Pseudomonadales bacterium]|nr:single-stranded DNA-binding protein [Pseudomonadales bacterium]
MASLNSVNLTGRIVATPELKTTTSGKDVTSFTLAVSGYKDSTDFIDIVAWGATAKVVTDYKQKGDELAVTGRISVRSYDDKDGNKRKAFEVVAENIAFIGGRSQQDSAPVDVAPIDIDDKPIDLSEIPFN